MEYVETDQKASNISRVEAQLAALAKTEDERFIKLLHRISYYTYYQAENISQIALLIKLAERNAFAEALSEIRDRIKPEDKEKDQKCLPFGKRTAMESSSN